MVYNYRAAQHPDYFVDYADPVTAKQKQMMKLDLSCINSNGVDPEQSSASTDLLYAEILQIYGEVEIANAARVFTLDSGDALARLKRASAAANLGLSIVKPQANAQKLGASNALVEDQHPTELRYLLERVSERARGAQLQ